MRFDPIEITSAFWRQTSEIALIIVVTLMVNWIVSRRFPKLFPSASLIVTVLRASILSIGFLVVLGSLGVSIAPVLTALGVGGLAVALALRDTLANLFSGIQILASRQVAPGDFIRFDGGEGYVADITWRNTTILDVGGGRIIVPNEKLANAIVSNATRVDGMHIVHTFGIQAALDIEAMLAAARAATASLAVLEIRVIGQNDAMVTCVAVVRPPRDGDAFVMRSAVAEAIATLPRIERASQG